MEKLILSIKRPHLPYPELVTFDCFPVFVGRGYDNNLTLKDPYISSRHLQIDAEGKGWRVTEAGGENGFSFEKKKVRSKSVILQSGDVIICGKVRLTFLAADHPVSKTRPLHTGSLFFKKPDRQGFLALAMMIGFGLKAYYVNYTNDTAHEVTKHLAVIFGAAFIWGGFWALVGKLAKHEWQFSRHYNEFIIFVVGFVIAASCWNFSEYRLCTDFMQNWWGVLLPATYFLVLLYRAFGVSTNLKLRDKIMTIILIMAGMTWMSYTIELSEKKKFQNEAWTDPRLYPSFGLSPKGKTPEQFVRGAQMHFNQHQTVRDPP